MKNYINKYFFNCIIWCAIEQIFVAMSTVCMIKMGQSIVEKDEILRWSCLFIILLFIVFIPRYGYQCSLTKAKYNTFRMYMEDFLNSYKYKTYLCKEIEFINPRKTFFHNETWNVINESYDFILDFILTLFNVCFNVGIIGFVISKEFIFSYMFAFLIALVFCVWFQKKAEDLTMKFQDRHVKMNSTVLYGWDTILASNVYNCNLWNNALGASIEETIKYAIRKLRYISSMSGVAMVISSAPVFIVLIHSLLFSTDMEEISALIVTLPRQINTIQYLNIFITLLMGWNGVYGKIQGLKKAIVIPKELEFKERYVKFNSITIQKEGMNYNFKSMDKLICWIESKKTGRITVRGGNGTGKSTLIIGLKTYWKDNAYYFSPNLLIYFSDSLNSSLSTGELVLLHLEEIFKNVKYQILLLDEWDANLDVFNIEKIDDLIDKISEKKCVIEIRHRNESSSLK